ncbi:MAG: radical SAM protein [Deltaproteobacteria bacterium]|nr:radical SAM protein [Deltaproteobacteria bacterium]
MSRPLLVTVDNAPPARRVEPLRDVPAGHLRVHEVYASVQGESTFQGRPCAFLRTTGCHLRCHYCDTAHAFYDGTVMSVDAVVERMRAFGLPLAEVTGGEPLLQPAVHGVMRALCDAGLTVLLETSGGVATDRVDPRVRIILDVKTPSSGEAVRNVWGNLARLRPHDEVKFVIGSAEDYAFTRRVLDEHRLAARCTVLLSPVTPGMDPPELAAWIIRDRLPVRFQVQLHKVLWGDRRGV